MVASGVAARPFTRETAFPNQVAPSLLRDRYVVTSGGRLCLVGNGWQDDGEFAGAYDSKANVDTDFQGDIRLVSVGGEHTEYVARFTHGKLEWIQLMAEVPERVRRNLMSG
jgi:hypothetical protein